jgi:hypothetical protein
MPLPDDGMNSRFHEERDRAIGFPRNSVFDQGAGVVPEKSVFRTPEENRRISDAMPKGVHVPLSVLEDWIGTLENIEGDSAADVLPDLILDMRSYFRG